MHVSRFLSVTGLHDNICSLEFLHTHTYISKFMVNYCFWQRRRRSYGWNTHAEVRVLGIRTTASESGTMIMMYHATFHLSLFNDKYVLSEWKLFADIGAWRGGPQAYSPLGTITEVKACGWLTFLIVHNTCMKTWFLGFQMSFKRRHACSSSDPHNRKLQACNSSSQAHSRYPSSPEAKSKIRTTIHCKSNLYAANLAQVLLFQSNHLPEWK